MVLRRHSLALLAVLFSINLVAAGSGFGLAPELITNLDQISHPAAAEVPARGLVQLDVPGTVLVGGNSRAVAVLDGSPALHLVPASPAAPLQRGERIQLRGSGMVNGTKLLEGVPLIDSDGLHSLYEMSGGLWLDQGRTPIRVRYFNRGGDRGLVVSIEGPGLPRQVISNDMLFHPETNAATGEISWRNGLQFRCYRGEWSVLPDFSTLSAMAAGVAANFDMTVADANLAGNTDNYGLIFEGYLAIPRPGNYTIVCASDDGSMVDLGETRLAVTPLGISSLPPLPRLAAGQLLNDDNPFCAAVEGVVTLATREDGGLRLELSSGRGRTQVWLPVYFATDPQWLMGLRVLATGICEGFFAPEGNWVAGQLTVYSEENLQVLDMPQRVWNSRPISSSGQLGARLAQSQTPQLVRLRGTLRAQAGALAIEDEAGKIVLAGGDIWDLKAGDPVEAFGLAGEVNAKPTLRCYALRQIESGDSSQNGLPLLTTVEDVKQLSRDEAKRGYPVKVRGVVTHSLGVGGFFLQDQSWSIYVSFGTNIEGGLSQVGHYLEVEGKTAAEFAPDISAQRVTWLGRGAMPNPERPNFTQLVDGSMDTQYIEVQGVVLSVTGTTLDFLTSGGRVAVDLPDVLPASLTKYLGALVRVRGCLVPQRDINTQQVKLGGFGLASASLAVDQPAPADPFALPLKHASDLFLFESHVSPIQRVKIGGVVLQQRGSVAYLMDGTNGLRLGLEAGAELHPGDRIEAVGFPDLTGPSPVITSALVRRLAPGPMPEPIPLMWTNLLNGQYDSTHVVVEGALVSERLSGTDQILEMQSGTRPWMARLPLRGGVVPAIPRGSELKLAGVYLGQGGDRIHGRDIDAFEVLLNWTNPIMVLRSPPWWTARHALTVAGALLAVLLLAAIWIWALRRRVEERTHALKVEIEDHKHTEIELEKKTNLLTQEIQERRRIEAEVERGHKQLLITSRLAGMAEVATSILHNVGNVMTSVNVLSASIVDLVRNSKISSVFRLGELLGKNQDDLAKFVAEDQRGRQMPEYVRRLAGHLAEEQEVLLQKVKVLNENINHINEIVGMQQDYAQVSGVLETLRPAEVVEDALRMHGESLRRHDIELAREVEPIPAVTMDRHKVLQILFNLLENAKYACLQGSAPEKKIVVGLQAAANGFLRLRVADNGMGIARENLSRIFGQGFSTRKDGHGFGLHSSVLAAQDMGGSLVAYSDGLGKGATFVLEIPVTPPNKGARQK
jgi:signal transduction histidine kinase